MKGSQKLYCCPIEGCPRGANRPFSQFSLVKQVSVVMGFFFCFSDALNQFQFSLPTVCGLALQLKLIVSWESYKNLSQKMCAKLSPHVSFCPAS